MTSPSHTRLRTLLDTFLEGRTTLAEERELYDAYAAPGTLPDDLERQRPMIAWYASMARPAAILPAPRRWTLRLRIASVAALLVLVAGIATGLLNKSADNAAAEQYLGSYVIINGQRYTDYERLRPEIERSRTLIRASQQQADRMIRASMPVYGTDPYLDNIDMSDPDVAAAIHRVSYR